MKKPIFPIALMLLLFCIVGTLFFKHSSHIPLKSEDITELYTSDSPPLSDSALIARNKMVFASKLKALQKCTGKKSGRELAGNMTVEFNSNTITAIRDGFAYHAYKDGKLWHSRTSSPLSEPVLFPGPTRADGELTMETIEDHTFNFLYGAVSRVLDDKKCDE